MKNIKIKKYIKNKNKKNLKKLGSNFLKNLKNI